MSHDRGGSDQGVNPPRRPLAGGRAWWKGCRVPPGHGQGPLPPLCGAPPFAKAALGRYFPYWESSGSKGSPNEMVAA